MKLQLADELMSWKQKTWFSEDEKGVSYLVFAVLPAEIPCIFLVTKHRRTEAPHSKGWYSSTSFDPPIDRTLRNRKGCQLFADIVLHKYPDKGGVGDNYDMTAEDKMGSDLLKAIIKEHSKEGIAPLGIF